MLIGKWNQWFRIAKLGFSFKHENVFKKCSKRKIIYQNIFEYKCFSLRYYVGYVNVLSAGVQKALHVDHVVVNIVWSMQFFFPRFEDSELKRWSWTGHVFRASTRPQHVGPSNKNKHPGVELVPQCEDLNEEHVELPRHTVRGNPIPLFLPLPSPFSLPPFLPFFLSHSLPFLSFYHEAIL